MSGMIIYIIILYKVRPTVALDTPSCCWCEVRCCGGPHSCPWSAGETPGPISSGWWVGPGGNRGPVYILHCSLLSGNANHNETASE